MGGIGSGDFFPSRPSGLHSLIEEARKTAEQQRLDSDVNEFLQMLLMKMNERDSEKVQEYLAKIKGVLDEKTEVEQFLFGGSVAKHTYVDGLSDIDALVVLNRYDLTNKSPREVLKIFHKSLQDRLTGDTVQSIEKGTLAVTVTYRDGTEIQLLPAIRIGGTIAIPDAGGRDWNETNPKTFLRDLTKANDRLNGALVPTIKLMKSINDGFPAPKRLLGYHIESLCLDVTKGYTGAKTVKALLPHVFETASKRVLSSIHDVTGQSRTVDEYLGKSNSVERQNVSATLANVARRLKAATSVDQWKTILES